MKNTGKVLEACGDKWMFWMEEGDLLCCSSMCDADGGCPNMYRCRELPEFIRELMLMEWQSKVREALKNVACS